MINTSPICTLDEAVRVSDGLEGITLRALDVYDTIQVRTRYSDYELLLLDPESGQALVRGGDYFVEPMEVTVNGSTFGGCMLKSGWLGVGLRMELYCHGRGIITSPIVSVSVAPPNAESEEVGCQPVAAG